MAIKDDGAARLPETHKVHFLCAEHAFDAETLTDPVSLSNLGATCLSFEAGDIVFQHLVHSSGWADVTLVKTFERGWVPAEYFTSRMDPRALALLAAAGRFLSQPRSHRLPGAVQYTFSETSINHIITGTKQLLDELNVLSRDSPLVVSEPVVAQARKAILMELAHLVHVARSNPRSTSPEVIGKLMRGVYRLIDRMQELLVACDNARETPRYVNPVSALSGTELDGTKSMPKNSNVVLASNSAHLAPSSAGTTGTTGTQPNTPNPQVPNGGSNPATPRPLSFIDHNAPPDPEARLQEVTAAFVAYLAEFENPTKLLSDPNNPTTSTAILSLTRRCMLSCREMLAVLDVHPTAFEEVKDELLESIRRLVGAARSIVAVLPPAPVSLATVATQNLVFVAQRCHELCLRGGNECLELLRKNPGLELSKDRSYPVFPDYPSVLGVNEGPLTPLQPPNDDGLSSTSNTPDMHTPATQFPVPRTPENFSRSTTPLASRKLSRSPRSPRSPSRPKSSNSSRSSPKSMPRTPRTPHARSKSVEPGLFLEQQDVPVLSPSTPVNMGMTSITITPNKVRDQFTASLAASAASPKIVSPNRRTVSMPENSFMAQIPPELPLVDLEQELVIRNNSSVRGGSVRALVAYLCNGSQVYSPSELEIRAFLLCFRLFSTPENFVAALIMARHAGAPEVAHMATVWVTRFWCPEDEGVERDAVLLMNKGSSGTTAFSSRNNTLRSNDRNVTPTIESINETSIGSSSTVTYLDANESVDTGNEPSVPQFLLEEKTEVAFKRAVPPPLEWIAPAPSRDPIKLLLNAQPEKVAEQLTLVWFDIFSRINAFELIDQRFSHKPPNRSANTETATSTPSVNAAKTKPEAGRTTAARNKDGGLAPNVNELIQSSNHLSAFIGDTMLAENLGMENRVDILRKWIKIAEHFYKIGNLNGAVTITLTLSSDRIYGLARTWAQLEPGTREIYDKLRPLVLPDRNFSEYRRELRSRAGTSCIPFLGLVLGDLVLIDEGNPKFLEPSRAVNFDRYVKTCRVIASVQTFQACPFSQTHDLPLQTALLAEMAKSHKRDSIDEEDQWRRSRLIQKKENIV